MPSELPGEDLALCPTCGTQYDTPSDQHPSKCTICEVGPPYCSKSLSHQYSCTRPFVSSSEKQRCSPSAGSAPIRTSCRSDLDLTPQGEGQAQERMEARCSRRKDLEHIHGPKGSSGTLFVRYLLTYLCKLGIGERAMLIKTPQGNVLWDCFAYLGDETIEFVSDLGPRTPPLVDKNRSTRTAA